MTTYASTCNPQGYDAIVLAADFAAEGIGPFGPATAGVAVDGPDPLDWSGVVWNEGNMAQDERG